MIGPQLLPPLVQSQFQAAQEEHCSPPHSWSSTITTFSSASISGCSRGALLSSSFLVLNYYHLQFSLNFRLLKRSTALLLMIGPQLLPPSVQPQFQAAQEEHCSPPHSWSSTITTFSSASISGCSGGALLSSSFLVLNYYHL